MQDENTLREVAKDCVHCGFCLPACPTYQLWAEEMDSPRGRIYLVNQILDGNHSEYGQPGVNWEIWSDVGGGFGDHRLF